MKTFLKTLKENKNCLQELSELTFPTLQEAIKKANEVWESCFPDLDSRNEENQEAIAVLNLLQTNNCLVSRIVEIPSKISFLSYIKHLIGKEVSFCSYQMEINGDDIDKLEQLFKEADRLVEDLKKKNTPIEIPMPVNPVINGKEMVTFDRFETLVEAFQLILFDVYGSLDERISKTVKRDVIRRLHGQGYDVVDYNGENDNDFDVRYEDDCTETEVVSPSIRRISDGVIIKKGIVNKPNA